MVTWERVAAAVGALLMILAGALWTGHESRISALEESDKTRGELVGRIDENVKRLLDYFELTPKEPKGHR